MPGTGQRIGDVLRMRWSDIEDGAIKVKQGKTGNVLWIPIRPRLGSVLDAYPGNGLWMCSREDAQPLSYRRAAYAVDAVRRVLGLGAYTIHGLRHSAAAELAEAGCTDAQIAADLTRAWLMERVAQLPVETRRAASAYLNSCERDVDRLRRTFGRLWRGLMSRSFRRSRKPIKRG